jgi:hypothetical protein
MDPNPGVLYQQIINGQWTFGEGWDGISTEAKVILIAILFPPLPHPFFF